MDSVFERQRHSHEAIERLENLAASLMVDAPRTHKERLARAHRVSKLTDKIMEFSRDLFECYEDVSNTRQTEFDSIACHEGDFAEFYSRLDDIREFHHGNTTDHVEPMEIAFMGADPAAEDARLLQSLFSGEEHGGRYLGLHESHMRFVNLPDSPKIGYIAYLEQLRHGMAGAAELDRKIRTAPEYVAYVQALIDYLESFIARTEPLLDVVQLRQKMLQEFEHMWATARESLGWGDDKAEQLETGNAALFCVPCNKEFRSDQVFKRHFSEKRHRRAEAVAVALLGGPAGVSAEQLQAARQQERQEVQRAMARSEQCVDGYIKHLARELTATIEGVERKQTLTEVELFEEQAEESAAAAAAPGKSFKSGRAGPGQGDTDSDDSDDDDDRVYNPLRLPLGWDGKPIPYWLYKLHGLGVEYSCEICGNYVYMGRKAYERHFQEWRHAHGMRCLGIPNTRHFYEINLIEDAQTLYQKLKNAQRGFAFRNEDEEFEDSEGNVYNRKTYEDLLRQGLL